jgi:hypothetical protein
MTVIRHSLTTALVGALALSTINLTPAAAAALKSGAHAKQSSATVTFSARRRYNPGGAIVLGAVAGIFGTIAALAARDRYYDEYYGPYPYYYGTPRYYYYAPRAYPRYRYYRHYGVPSIGGWHGRHHHH